MSIFIATIVDSYAQMKQLENSEITKKFISQIIEEWSKIDQEGKGHISYHQFWHFCPVFMKLYEEDKSLPNSFTGKKPDFLEKVKIEVYECEEGVALVDFHNVIVSLTKVYVENISNEKIMEEKVHTILEIRPDLGKSSSSKSICEGRMSNIVLLREGLKRWRDKALAASTKEVEEPDEGQE